MAVDLGTAYAELELRLDGFQAQVQKMQNEFNNAIKQMKQSNSSFSESLDKVSEKLSSFGKKATALITTPIVGAVTASIKSFADLEQAVGGVETIFKSGSDTIIKYAEQAYKNAGISATDYMEQVTSFGASLMQSLGDDYETGAEIANTAVNDMGDNVNKFGTNIESVQNAYQGFAKKNYTMLDNLKLGYGGTKEEMERLLSDANKINEQQGIYTSYSIENFADIIEAIHTVQNDMGITGTTGKEAMTTISGSINTAKAAFFNLIAGLADGDADIQTLISNVVSSVGTAKDNIVAALQRIWENLPLTETGKQLLVVAASIGPVSLALSKVVSIGSSLASGIKVVTALFAGLSAPVLAVVAAVTALVVIFKTAWDNVDGFKEKVTESLSNIKASWDSFESQIVERLNNLGISVDSIWEAIKTGWSAFVEVISPLITTALDLFATSFDGVLNTIISLFDIFTALFKGNWETAGEELKTLVSNYWETIKSLFSTAFDGLKSIADNFLALFGTDWETAWNGIKDTASTIWEGIKSVLSGAMDTIKALLSGDLETVKTNFSDAWAKIKEVWSPISDFFSGLWDAVKAVFDPTIQWFTDKFNAAWDAIETAFSSVSTFFTDLWDDIVDCFDISEIFDIGENLVKGLWNGISNVTEWILEKIKGFGDSILSGIKSFFGIHSPSTEMASVGEYLVEGLGKGFDNKAKWIDGEVTDFCEDVIDTINDTLGVHSASDKTESTGEYLVEGLYNGIVGAKNLLGKGITKVGEWAIDKFTTLGDEAETAVAEEMSGLAKDFEETEKSITKIDEKTTSKLEGNWSEACGFVSDNSLPSVKKAFNTTAKSLIKYDASLQKTIQNNTEDTTEYVIAKWDGMTKETSQALSKASNYVSTATNKITQLTSALFDYNSTLRENEMNDIQDKIDESNDLYAKQAEEAKTRNAKMLANAEATYDADLAALKESYSKGLISSETYASKKEALAQALKDKQVQLEQDLTDELAKQETARSEAEMELLKQKDEINRKQFEADKNNQIATAVINAAQSILMCYAQGGFILGSIYAAVVAAATAIEIANIKAQEYVPLLAKGGIIDKPTLAMIGEDGKEVVMPLENNAEWIDMLAEKLSGKVSGGGNYNITFNSPKAINEFEARRQMKIAIRDIAEGF